MAKFRPELETCPVCGCRGECHIHAYYDRYIIDWIDGRRQEDSVRIMRVMCDNCENTHAILPDIIIPYSSHGLLFILHVLSLHFSGISTIDKICSSFGITRNAFFQWLSLWREHKREWLGALKDAQTDSSEFMDRLRTLPLYSEFSAKFILETARSFLQNHKNPVPLKPKPAPYCQNVFTPHVLIW